VLKCIFLWHAGPQSTTLQLYVTVVFILFYMASGALRSSHVKLLKVSKVKLKHSESEVGYSEVAAFSYCVYGSLQI